MIKKYEIKMNVGVIGYLMVKEILNIFVWFKINI